MNRIDALFARLKAEDRRALMPFLTAGDPDLAMTAALIREAPGADNAVVRLRVEPPAVHSDDYRALAIIDVLADRPIPGPAGQTLPVHAFDAQGTEHAVRAGNYSNPRWLEWGPSYRPIPGDSGGGVFFLRRGTDGGSRPVLIGVVVERSDRGGGASLISRQQRWLAEALPR